MTKATYRRKDLFGLMVPGGKSLSWWGSLQLEMELKAFVLSHKQKAERPNWKRPQPLDSLSWPPVAHLSQWAHTFQTSPNSATNREPIQMSETMGDISSRPWHQAVWKESISKRHGLLLVPTMQGLWLNSDFLDTQLEIWRKYETTMLLISVHWKDPAFLSRETLAYMKGKAIPKRAQGSHV